MSCVHCSEDAEIKTDNQSLTHPLSDKVTYWAILDNKNNGRKYFDLYLYLEIMYFGKYCCGGETHPFSPQNTYKQFWSDIEFILFGPAHNNMEMDGMVSAQMLNSVGFHHASVMYCIFEIHFKLQ